MLVNKWRPGERKKSKTIEERALWFNTVRLATLCSQQETLVQYNRWTSSKRHRSFLRKLQGMMLAIIFTSLFKRVLRQKEETNSILRIKRVWIDLMTKTFWGLATIDSLTYRRINCRVISKRKDLRSGYMTSTDNLEVQWGPRYHRVRKQMRTSKDSSHKQGMWKSRWTRSWKHTVRNAR